MRISLLVTFLCCLFPTNLVFSQEQEPILKRLERLEKQLNETKQELAQIKQEKQVSENKVAYNVPIGTIVGWHKSLPNTPPLPYGFVECNGQVLNDSASLYNGQTIPNLNSADGYKGGRFLRGGTISGQMQEGTKNLCMIGGANPISFYFSPGVWNATDNDGLFGTPRPVAVVVGSLTGWSLEGERASRPVNMTVVWIMKIR